MTKSGSEFLSALTSLKPDNGRTTGFACGVSRLLDSLEAEEASALLALIDNRDITVVRIAELLITHNHPLSVQQLRKHRNRQKPGGCKCLKEQSQ